MPGYYEGKKVTFHSAASADANGTVMNVAGKSVVVVQISGTFTTAVVYFEATVNGSNWVAIQGTNLNNGAVANNVAAAGIYQIPVLGMRLFRARLDWTSGTSITVVGICTEGPPVPLNDIDVAATETVAVSSIAAGTNNIGDVDVLTLPSPISGPGNPTIDSYSTAAVNCAAAVNQVLVADPGAGKAIWVFGLFMMADTGAGTVLLTDDADTAMSGVMAVSDEGGWVLPISGNFAMPWIKVTTHKALHADCTTSTVDGLIAYAVVTV